MRAIILAAGQGTRLQPLTLETPKPLLQINNETIIDRIFKSLPDEINEVCIVIQHLGEKIQSYVGENFYNKRVVYLEQKEKRGTYGALLSAKDYFNENERFLVLNGDDLHDKQELEKYLQFSRSFGIQKMHMPNYYSMSIDSNEYIESFRPQTEEEKNLGALVATGVYVIDSNIFKHPGVVINGGEYGLPQTILEQKDEFPVKAIITEHWIPINSFKDKENAENYFKNLPNI